MNIRLGLHLGFITGVAAVLLAWNQVGVPKPVRLEVNGEATTYQTRQVRVGGFLKEIGLGLEPGDRVTPPPDAAIPTSGAVAVTRATPVLLTVNGAPREVRTSAAAVEDALREAGIRLGAYDEVRVDGLPATLQTPLQHGYGIPLRRLSATAPTSRDPAPRPPRKTLEVRQARAIYVHDGGHVYEVATLEPRLGPALAAAGIRIRPEDVTQPSLGEAVQAGQHVFIARAKPLVLTADGAERTVWTHSETVGQALRWALVRLGPSDVLLPGPDAPIGSGTQAKIVRVREESHTEEEKIAFETRSLPDPDLERGKEWEAEPGSPGLYKRVVRVRYEDGQETGRAIEREWVEAEPQPRVVYYGTKVRYVAPRSLDVDVSGMECVRSMTVWATWYRPASSGRPAGHPAYGVTSTGMIAQRGVIAVDPRVIPYYTRIYVPGYGVGIAADTGGSIKGNMIDLAFSDDDVPNWRTGWVDICLLG